MNARDSTSDWMGLDRRRLFGSNPAATTPQRGGCTTVSVTKGLALSRPIDRVSVSTLTMRGAVGSLRTYSATSRIWKSP